MLRNWRHSHVRELDVLLLPIGALIVMLLLALFAGPHLG